jgi:hypothetical protein
VTGILVGACVGLSDGMCVVGEADGDNVGESVGNTVGAREVGV